MGDQLKTSADGNPSEPTSARPGEREENPRVWACFVLLLVVYVLSAFRVGPVGFLGRYEDDTLYFSAAKALASGQGYVQPGFPIPLKATKYPELYPLLLAGIWKIDPHFPANVNLAAGLTLASGCLSLVFAFLLLRRWRGLGGDWPALAVVTLCALTGHFLELSASVMSGVPFMALMLGALWLAETERWKTRGAVAAGLLAGLSVGVRSLGIAACAGIGLAFLLKRKYRRLGWFCAVAAPLTLFFLWPAVLAAVHPAGARLAVGPGDSGWTQTLCYYSSYSCNWRMNVTDFRTLASVVKVNLLFTSAQPGAFLTLPLLQKTGLWHMAVLWLLSFAAWIGIVRRWKMAGPEAYILTFLFMLALILPWPYPTDRFLIPFLPLFFGAVAIETRNLASLVGKSLRAREKPAERVLAASLGLAGLALGATIAVNYAWSIPRQTARLANELAGALADRREAYTWIRRNTAPDAKIIAYEDGLVYLYTGRRSIRPINCRTQVYYLGDPSYAKGDAVRLFDVARHIGATYWLVAPDDFVMESPLDRTLLRAREKRLLAAAPLVFESADRTVKLYDIRCLTRVNQNACRKAVAQKGRPPSTPVPPRDVSGEFR